MARLQGSSASQSPSPLLLDHHEVLSPLAIDFVDPSAEFVRLRHEANESATSIDSATSCSGRGRLRLASLQTGHLGASTMFELGHAKALGIPIFSDPAPLEETYGPWITVVEAPPTSVLTQDLKAPGNGLRGLQRYYERASVRRGWDKESVQDTLLLMTEEMGELARAVERVSPGRDHDGKAPMSLKNWPTSSSTWSTSQAASASTLQKL